MSNGKIYAVSDLHVDQNLNMQWVENLSDDKYLNDTVIIPGDITHVPSKLIRTLTLFRKKFKDVYYCPGNHELWTKSQKEDAELNITNSIEKFHYIMRMCEEIGVHTKPGVTAQGVIIIPLFAWYDESLHSPHPDVISDMNLWTDTYQCVWTTEVPQDAAAKYFTQLNESNLISLNNSNAKIITFSHFLTSKKLMTAYRNEIRARQGKWQQTLNSKSEKQANFSLVAGTELLNEQLERIKPQVHIFGHSHRKMVLDIGDGIRYINNPLGYTKERDSGLIESPHEPYEINFDFS